MTGHDLAIVVPLWRRTAYAARCYESAYAATPLARVLFVVSAEDHDVVDYVNDAELDHLVLPGPGGDRGDYAHKINEGYRATTEPFIFTGADDLVFQPGWYGAARSLMTDYRDSTMVTPSGGLLTGPFQLARGDAVGVVGTVDDCNPRTLNGTHSTHSLVARWYADQGATVEQGAVIYHEGYWHEYCDDELVQTAMVRHAYAHAFDAHVTHLHPMLGTGVPDDETYQRGRSQTRMSRNLYMRRRSLWRLGATLGGQR